MVCDFTFPLAMLLSRLDENECASHPHEYLLVLEKPPFFLAIYKQMNFVRKHRK